VLQNYISKFIKDKEFLKEITPDLTKFGEKCSKEYIKLAEECERFKPVFEKYDAWGK
jgi:hypothetical protein